MDFLSNPILLALAGVVGILVGLLLSSLFSDRESSRVGSSNLPQQFKKEGFGEVARLWYSPAGKKLLTSLDGGFYSSFKDLSPEQQKRLLRLVQLMQEWVNPPVQSVPATEETTRAAAAAETAQVAATDAPQPEPPASAEEPFPMYIPPSREYGFLDELEKQVPAAEEAEIEPEKTELTSEPLPEPEPTAVEDEEPFVPAPKKPQSIVEQINDILQGIVAGSMYEKRGVSLQDDLHNGVIVYVGGEKFNGVEDVPYPDVQKMIRDAVGQWEHSLDSDKK